MIYVTGDTHGSFERLSPQLFRTSRTMTKDDYVIICGDFGGVWNLGSKENEILDRLDNRRFTLLFIDGNHENFDALKKYPVETWHGGKVHKIRPNVIHLMRGQIFDLDGRSFFTMGGARSHDIQDGVLDTCDPRFPEKYEELYHTGARFRVNHISWWKEEMPSDEEYAEARRNLEQANWKIDYVLTHCAPDSIMKILALRNSMEYESDPLSNFLEEVKAKTEQKHGFSPYWFFGHFHGNRILEHRFCLLYEWLYRVV